MKHVQSRRAYWVVGVAALLILLQGCAFPCPQDNRNSSRSPLFSPGLRMTK